MPRGITREDAFAVECAAAALRHCSGDASLAVDIVAGALLGKAERIRSEAQYSDDMSVVRRANETARALRERAQTLRMDH